MKTALVVIDLQAYFLKRAPSNLPTKIADHIRKSDYDFVAFTIFENATGSNWRRSLHWNNSGKSEDLTIPDELRDFIGDQNVFVKNSYSAFKNQEFASKLKHQQIERLEICGIDTDACVLATAYEAFDLGYEVKILFHLSHSRAGLDSAAKSIIMKNLQTKNDPR